MIVRGSITVGALGRSTPRALNRAIMPLAIPTPDTRPMTDASRPSTKPSSTTERMTCLREAPRVRSVANSRVRWATVIESVLKMTNAPTSSAMPAKPSRNMRIMFIELSSSAASSLAALALSFTCRVLGSSGLTARSSSAGDVPCLARIEMPSKRPSRCSSV